MQPRIQGIYALYIYYPIAWAARLARTMSRKIRGKSSKFEQRTSLPRMAAWRVCDFFHPPELAALEKRNGNVTIPELAILAALASKCQDGGLAFEIGTFDGRTTLNLALNTPRDFRIVTLDLPKGSNTKLAVETSEKHMIEKDVSGGLFNHNLHLNKTEQEKIRQELGDSAQFDFTPYHSRCSLFFVDGSHSYDYAMEDSLNALRCVAPSGLIVWHDYGVWKGVTRALEEIGTELELDLVHIAGTSLVVWRCKGMEHLARMPNRPAHQPSVPPAR